MFFDPKPPALNLKSISAYIFTLFLAPINLIRFILSVSRFKPEVINLHFVGSPALFLLLYLMIFKAEPIVSLHGSDVVGKSFSSKISRYLLKKILKKAETISANSHYITNEVLKIVPWVSNKLEVVHNGIDPKEFKSPRAYQHKNKYIFAVGRFVEKKGFDILIEAFDSGAKKVKDIDLIIAGEGPQKKEIEDLALKLGLGKRVLILGPLSRHEPFGIVILEAMACKKAIVATRSGGPQEIIEDGINGVLVEKENPQALGGAMIRLLQDPQMRQEVCNNAERISQRFNIKEVVRKYLRVFEKNRERSQRTF